MSSSRPINGETYVAPALAANKACPAENIRVQLVLIPLSEKGIKVTSEPDESNMPGFFSVLLSWFPMLLFIGVWIFFMRQMQGRGGGGAMGFGKSRARMLNENMIRKTFADVAGVEEAKEELQEIIGSGKSKRDAVKELTSKYQLSKRRVYDLSIEISVDET